MADIVVGKLREDKEALRNASSRILSRIIDAARILFGHLQGAFAATCPSCPRSGR
jgi:hypothetical protein